MKIIDQEVLEVTQVPSSREDTLKHIEAIGRVCYKSEDKIGEGTAERFCEMLFKAKHHAMIEHSWMVIKFSNVDLDDENILSIIFDSPFIKMDRVAYDEVLVYGNWRAFIDAFGAEDDLNFFRAMPEIVVESFCGIDLLPHVDFEMLDQDDIPMNKRAYTVSLLTDRAVTHEVVRHRPASFAQESQRYVKYDGIMEMIKPIWYDDASRETQTAWRQACEYSEKMYTYMRENGMKAEEARTVLPNSTATKIGITADVDEWNHIFDLRTAPSAYYQIRYIMKEVKETFTERNYI